jgi:isocitrate dehydrogenase
MNYALIVYRCNGEDLYTVEEFENCTEVEERIQELEDHSDQTFTYRVYCNQLTVKITPPAKSTVSVF